MHKVSKKVLMVGIVAAGLCAGTAQAVPINGAFSISGGVAPLGGATMDAATGLDFIPPIGANSCVGDIPGGANCGGASGAIQDLPAGTIVAPGVQNIPNWISLSVGGVSFDMNSIATITRTPSVGGLPAAVEIAGLGLMHETGFDNTPGTYRLTAQGMTGSFSFSSTQVSAGTVVKVPEPTTLALLGITLLGFAFARRRSQA